MNKFIPYGRHCIDSADIEVVTNVLKSDWLTCGGAVDRFENKLKEHVKADYAIACSNGTTALHLAMLALGIGAGDVVLVPAITFLASANAVRYVGADVIFVDVDQSTGLMTAQTLETAILRCKDKSLKAVVNVHFAGQCENLEAIQIVARKYNLWVIEDAAHAIGTVYMDEKGGHHHIGSNAFSDVTTFSFHPVKTIAMGEGGGVTTNNSVFADKIRLLRSHGMVRASQQWQCADWGFDLKGQPNPWYYEMHEVGFNYRISDINCALGASQLEKLGKFKEERSKIVDLYDSKFINCPHLTPLKKLKCSNTAWHLYIVCIDFYKLGKSRAEIMEKLKRNGIGSQVHYIPLHKQPYYRKLYGEQTLVGAEEYYAKCLSLPLYVGIDSAQLNFIFDMLI